MKTIFGILLLLALPAVSLHAQSKLRLKRDSGDMRTYSGQVRLTGKYSTFFDDGDFSGQLSFAEDRASRRKLPSNGWREGLIFLRRRGNDDRGLLRMFSIPSAGNAKVCGYQGTATIDIRDFTAVKKASEVGDGATLVRIVRQSKPKPVLCRAS